MSRFLGADVTALASIAGGTLLGGLATAALLSGSNHQDRGPREHAVDVACAAEVSPRIIVSHNSSSSSRVVVAPNVRIGMGSSCAEGAREIHIRSDRGHRDAVFSFEVQGMDQDARERMEEARERIAEAQKRMERAQVRVEAARERMDRTRVERLRRGDDITREAASLEALRSAEKILEQRLRSLEGQGLEELNEIRERMATMEIRLSQDLDQGLREDLVREMRTLRVELDRAQAEARGKGN